MKIREAIGRWLRNSARIHVRSREVATIADLVALIDRFLDDKLDYALEWDDFISWNHGNPNIELIRTRIAATEPLFFSDSEIDHDRGMAIVVDERNRAAALVNISERTLPRQARRETGEE